jgi:hypothetical protein
VPTAAGRSGPGVQPSGTAATPGALTPTTDALAGLPPAAGTTGEAPRWQPAPANTAPQASAIPLPTRRVAVRATERAVPSATARARQVSLRCAFIRR